VFHTIERLQEPVGFFLSVKYISIEMASNSIGIWNLSHSFNKFWRVLILN